MDSFFVSGLFTGVSKFCFNRWFDKSFIGIYARFADKLLTFAISMDIFLLYLVRALFLFYIDTNFQVTRFFATTYS